MQEFFLFLVVGFLAQAVDGALGMAYGVTASSLLLGLGVPPAVGSATVHAAECFTTGASAASHHAFGNIDKTLFRRLLLPGVVGAAIVSLAVNSAPASTRDTGRSGDLTQLSGSTGRDAKPRFEDRSLMSRSS